MRREVVIPALLGLVVLAGALLTGDPARGPSIESSDAAGLLGAHAYLGELGVTSRGADLRDARLDETLMVAFPSLTPWSDDDASHLRDRIFAGQRVVLLVRDGQTADANVLRYLDMSQDALDERFPPRSWQAWWDRELTLGAREGNGTLTVRRPQIVVTPPSRAESLWTTPDGLVVGFRYGLGEGEVVVYGAGNPFANAWLGRNLEELERVVGHGDVVFEEAHHRAEELATAASPLAVPLARFGWHVLLLYAVGVWAIAWRFGPPRRKRTLLAGSVEDDLRGMGALARDGRRASEAARRLLGLALRELDGQDARRLPTRVGDIDERELVALGRHVARLQQGPGGKA